MSLAYGAVGWNPAKRRYDRVFLLAIVAYLAVFIASGFATHPEATAETLVLRALGTAAFLSLHVVLAIGPLARLDSRFLPLLYNRRHLGVATCGLGLAHGIFALIQFHAFGDLDPIVSLLSAESGFDRLSAFPFQIFGAFALVVLCVMAATSHDFWLENLGPMFWKRMHMAVYVAYFALLVHVAFGALANEDRWVFDAWVASGAAALFTLHGLAGIREWKLDRRRQSALAAGFVAVARVDELVLDRGRTVSTGGERIALFRHRDGISAIGNVCRHQGGPLGEGRIVNGCVTCPWHGYQYLAQNGCSPPPFTEKVETYRVQVIASEVFVDPIALPPGTAVEPAKLEAPIQPAASSDFYVGYLDNASDSLRRWLRRRVTLAIGGALVLAAHLGVAQARFSAASFEYGQERSFEGVIDEFPVPSLLVERPGTNDSKSRFSRFVLVDAFKFGAAPRVKGLDGKSVRLAGTLIRRDGTAMIELGAAAPELLVESRSQSRPTDEDLGVHVLRGEIVDSKCWYGVMKPGEWVVHRACAVRCISGGIPPLLVVNDRQGGSLQFLLVAPDGGALNAAILDRIAEPVVVTGRVVRRGSTYFLYADPVAIVRR